MTLNDREKKIALGTGIVLGGIVFYQLILGPLIESRAQAMDRLEKARTDLATDHQTMSSSRRLAGEFAKMSGPSMKRDAPEAEGQVLNQISEWARESGLTLVSVKAETGEKEKGYQKITFRATANGGMLAISRFLYRIETANIPVRVSDIAITSHKEGTDDLEARLAITTIYAVAPDKPAPEPPRRVRRHY